VVRDRVRILDLSLVVVLASLRHGGCVGGSGDVGYWTFGNRAPAGRVFETVVVCKLVWILTSGPVVNITGHVSLVGRWCGQIGSAGSESIIVTAADVPVIRVVAMVCRGFFEVGLKIFFGLSLANLLNQEEDGAGNDCGTDQADNSEGGAHGRLVLQEGC